MGNKIDPWLYPGCICEIWDDKGHTSKSLVYFIKHNCEGLPVFAGSKDAKYGRYADHYKPIGTPWDFAPRDAKFIQIFGDKELSTYEGGAFFFLKPAINVIEKITTDKYVSLSTKPQFWNKCPDCLKGLKGLLPRPEWATDND